MSSLSDEEIRLRLLQFLAKPPKIGTSAWGIHKSIIREAIPVQEKALDNNIFYLARMGLIKLVQPGTEWLWAKITPVGLDVLQNPTRYKERFLISKEYK
jgi:hypothetical protein